MKRYFQALIALSTILIVCASGCKKMDDTYRQFVEAGETVYIGKADSVIVRGGDTRVEVSWLLLSDPKVDNYKLYWNNRRDSITSSVTKTDKVDTVRVLLTDMPEGTHHFEIVMFDKYGNSSVPTRVSGKVYGPEYDGTLLNRTYRGMQRINNDLELNWMPAETTLLGVEVEYVNDKGIPVTHIVSPLVEKDILSDFPTNGEFRYRSLFLPDPLALDTFYTGYTNEKIDDRVLRAKQIEFTTRTQYGAQNDQLSILISQDFNGIYTPENINAATWTVITNEFPLATANTQRLWGPLNVTDMVIDGPVYVAFKYVFDPKKSGGQRTWRIENFEMQTLDGKATINQAEADFQLIHETGYQEARSSITPAMIQLRGNTTEHEVYKVDWAISGPLR